MPIATPQGTLDFKSVDTITFVGASSNTVIDTTTGSLGVGVGVGGPTSNLHVVGHTRLEGDINMLHTSNTASIKLNSNVVTEFPRSKKLIKYPRVAMTGETTSNYTVTGSSWYNSGAAYEPWRAFDNVGNHPSGQLAWYSFDYPTTEAYSGTDNAFNPNHGGTATPDLFTGAVQGEWLKIQLPHKVALDHYIMYGPNQETEFPRDWTVYGSVNGTNWVRVDSRVSQVFGAGTGGGGTATGKKKEYQLDTPTNEFLYFAFVFTKASPNRTTYVGVGEIELYGIPEYDPDAHGTDVVVKSVPNVPNTDWLEVYYDAKNYSGAGDVQDETANNRDAEMNATFDNGEIKAFNFSGAYTSNVTTSDHGLGTGDVTYTMSYWFKRTAVAGTYDYVVMLGDGGVLRSSILMWINNNQLTLDHWNAALRVLEPIVLDQWYHVAAGHSGGNTPNLENDFIYINGKRVTPQITQTAGSFTLAGSKLTLGSEHNGTTEFLNGSIANFRLFNRALTTDEIWQLYAYQKEYFGHGDLSMTLKAGRLGIGTSEPRAALDVRGDVNVEGRVLSGHASGGNESVVDGYKIHTFTSSSNFNVVTPGVVEYLIIGGGGGGGGTHGGGGGGGGFIQGHTLVKSGSHSIVVGGGGAGSTAQGANGVNSTAFGLTAVGGGGGGRGYDATNSSTGSVGGSSGGSGPFVLTGSDSQDFGKVPQKTYANRYQGNGGGGGNNTSGAGHGGGGGGAGGGGGNATTTSNYYAGNGISGAGGSGLVSYITGGLVIYAGGGSGGRWGGTQSINVQGGVGGTSGGGGIGGATGASGMAATAGGINTGGGGGGGGDAGGRGGNGGSGIVVLRYPV